MHNRLAHITLALLLFFSSTGLVLNKHYCQNELKSIALFLKAETCHSAESPAACPMHAGQDGPAEEHERKNCCDDRTEYLKAEQQQVQPTVERKWMDPHPAWSAALTVQSPGFMLLHRQILQYLNYKPPLLVWDLPVRLQTFLF